MRHSYSSHGRRTAEMGRQGWLAPVRVSDRCRRVSPVAERRGEGPSTGPTAATQLRRRPLFILQNGHSRSSPGSVENVALGPPVSDDELRIKFFWCRHVLRLNVVG